MKFNPEAFKHGKTIEDIKFLYASHMTEWVSNGISDRGNNRAMLVGFDRNGNLMEATATPEWQRKYEKKRRH